MIKRLVVIDSYAIMHRAYHALPPLTNRSGELTNAVYGYCSILLKVVADLNPQHLVAVFDTPETTFRHDLFIGYQSQRPENDEGLSGQIEKVHQLVRAFGIPSYEVPGYEADDVIGTLAKQSIEEIKILRYKDTKRKKIEKPPNISISQCPNIEVIIVSGDKDLFQLVNKKVKLFMPVRGLSETQLFGEKEVLEKMGVRPDQIIDYKALVGDQSDNYPGVPGIGPKNAVELLKKFGTLEKIYQSLNKIQSSALREKLQTGRESALLSQKLATIVTSAPVKLDLEESMVKDFNRPEAAAFLKEFGFKSLIARINGGVRDRDKDRDKKDDTQQRLF